jgi:hypothetical protein
VVDPGDDDFVCGSHYVGVELRALSCTTGAARGANGFTGLVHTSDSNAEFVIVYRIVAPGDYEPATRHRGYCGIRERNRGVPAVAYNDEWIWHTGRIERSNRDGWSSVSKFNEYDR